MHDDEWQEAKQCQGALSNDTADRSRDDLTCPLQQRVRFCSHAREVLALAEDYGLIQVHGLERPRLPLLRQHCSQATRRVAKDVAACMPRKQLTVL